MTKVPERYEREDITLRERWMILNALRRAVLCAALALFLIACSDDAAPGRESTEKRGGIFAKNQVEQKGSYYYRIKSAYNVRETGDLLEFDFVVACSANVTHWNYTGPSTRVDLAPWVMIKPTSNGGAVMMRAYRALCQNGLRFGNKKQYGAPSDLLPFVIWFDDVNDLSFGWGYATEDAYHSANSKLEFRAAVATVSNYEEWEAWRKRAAAEYKQVGAIPSPWGYSYLHTPKELNKEIMARNGGKWIANNCHGYVRVPVPKKLIEKIWNVAPADSPAPADGVRYFPINGDYTWVEKLLREAGAAFNGHDFDDYLSPVATSFGAINRNNGGFIQMPGTKDKVMGEHYPILPRSRSTSSAITKPADVYPRRILIGEEWRGMLACGGDSGLPGPDQLVVFDHKAKISANGLPPVIPEKSFDVEWREKKYPLYINDKLIAENVMATDYAAWGSDHIYIIDKEGFVLARNPWGWGGM